jgi:hypothetical protein
VVPLTRAHAHNDYLTLARCSMPCRTASPASRPTCGWFDGELLVGHDESQLQPGRTLASLYLDPLRKRVSERRHGLPELDRHFQLLIDVKNDATATYQGHRRRASRPPQDHDQLRGRHRLPGRRHRGHHGAATSRSWRHDDPLCGVRRRLSELDAASGRGDCRLVSDSWFQQFTWRGVGPMPEAEHAKLLDIVTRAHAAGYRVRFWDTPELKSPPAGRSGPSCSRRCRPHQHRRPGGLKRFLRTHD